MVKTVYVSLVQSQLFTELKYGIQLHIQCHATEYIATKWLYQLALLWNSFDKTEAIPLMYLFELQDSLFAFKSIKTPTIRLSLITPTSILLYS